MAILVGRLDLLRAECFPIQLGARSALALARAGRAPAATRGMGRSASSRSIVQHLGYGMRAEIVTLSDYYAINDSDSLLFRRLDATLRALVHHWQQGWQ
jgi:hypothetical protein